MDFKSNETIYSQITEYLKKQIFSGSFACGTRLSYEDFIAPVFVLNAIQRSLESGNEEKINKFEV